MNELAYGIAWYVAFLLSTTLHEAAHAWAALKGGDPTAYEGGQVSLDPIPHIARSPIGMVVVPLLSFVMSNFMMGWASAPYDPIWARRYPRRAAWMALAGPAANLVLVVVAGIGIRFLLAGGDYFVPDAGFGFTNLVSSAEDGVGAAIALFLSLMFSLNVLLFVLNMIPLPPLDGSAAIGLVLPEPQMLKLQDLFEQPVLATFGILFAFLIARELYGPVWIFAVRMLYPDVFA